MTMCGFDEPSPYPVRVSPTAQSKPGANKVQRVLCTTHFRPRL